MVLLGFAWLARFLARGGHDAGVRRWACSLGSVALSLFVHLLVTFPTGPDAHRAQRVLVVVGYLLSAPLDAVFLALGAQRGRGEGPPPNGLVIAPSNGGFTPEPVDLVVQAVVVALLVSRPGLGVVALARGRVPPSAAALTPGLVGGTVIVATLLVERTAILLLLPPSAGVVLAWSAQVVLVVWPVALLLGPAAQPARPLGRRPAGRRARGRACRSPGACAGRSPARCTTRRRSSPTACPAPTPTSTPRGDPVAVAAGRRPRRHPPRRDGAPIAVLLHDPALAGEPDLVEAVAAGRGAGGGERAPARRGPPPAARGPGVAGPARRGRRRRAPAGRAGPPRRRAAAPRGRRARAAAGPRPPGPGDAGRARRAARRGRRRARRRARRAAGARPRHLPGRCSPTQGSGRRWPRSPSGPRCPSSSARCRPAARRRPSSRPATSWCPRRWPTPPSTRRRLAVGVGVVPDADGLRVDVVDDGVRRRGRRRLRAAGPRRPCRRARRAAARVQPRPRRHARDGDAAVRVIVADDAALFRAGIARLLADRGHRGDAPRSATREALLAAVRADPPGRGPRRHPDAADPHHRGPRRRAHARGRAPRGRRPRAVGARGAALRGGD